jgi:hypothetical protein
VLLERMAAFGIPVSEAELSWMGKETWEIE